MPQHALTGEADFDVTLSVGGVPVPDVFSDWDGGDTEADVEMIYPGGQQEAEAYVSAPSTSMVTISRPYRAERDAPLKKWLTARIGQPAVAAKQAKTADRRRVPGGLETSSGKLVGVTTPKARADGRTVTRLEVRIAVEGSPS